MSKKIFAAGAATIALVLWLLYATTPVVTEPKPTPAPAPCELQCLVEKRADAIHERDQAKYRQQSDLKALIEIQAELQLLTIEHKN
jgi:hypothetical protein